MFEAVQDQLVGLAEKAGFSADMTAAERRLLRSVAAGEWKECGDLAEDQRVIRAALFEWLFLLPEPRALLHPKGVQLEGAVFPGGFDLEDATIDAPLWLHKCSFQKTLMLRRARTRTVSLIGSKLGGSGAQALNAGGSRIDGDLFLRGGFEAAGEIHLLGATITENLELDSAKLTNEKGPTLTGAVLTVGGYAHLGELQASGQVNLVGAKITGDLNLRSAKLTSKDGPALSGAGLTVGGFAFLGDGFEADGEVNLVGATIERSLSLEGSKIRSAGSDALDLMNAKIRGYVSFVNPWYGGRTSHLEGRVVLRHARVGQIHDSEEVWEPTDHQRESPEPPVPDLDGLEYDSLGRSPIDPKFRIRWLRRGQQDDEPFAPQPFTQLASVLSEAGHEKEAKQLLIEREAQRLRLIKVNWLRLAFLRLFHGLLLGYGYRPGRALVPLVALWIAGIWIFHQGWAGEQFVPSVPFIYNSYVAGPAPGGSGESSAEEPTPDPAVQPSLLGERQRHAPPYTDLTSDGRLPEYPGFVAWVYSLDTLLPVVNLHQEPYWLPTGLVRWYLWAHIAGGWVFSTLFVVGFTGVVRRGE